MQMRHPTVHSRVLMKTCLTSQTATLLLPFFSLLCLPCRMNSREREITFFGYPEWENSFQQKCTHTSSSNFGSGGCAFSAGCSKSGKAKCKQFIFFIMLQCSECTAHLSKCPSDLKQNGTQEILWLSFSCSITRCNPFCCGLST